MAPLSFLQHVDTQAGQNVWALSHQQPVLLVFLRHFGCVFCREAMTELARLKDQIGRFQTRPILVHLSDSATAGRFFEQYQLQDIDYISDPEGLLYQQFGLVRGKLPQLMGMKVWLRTIQAGVLQGHGLGTQLIGDGFQMPGVFLIYQGEVREQFIHRTIADRPDYLRMAACIDCHPDAKA